MSVRLGSMVPKCREFSEIRAHVGNRPAESIQFLGEIS